MSKTTEIFREIIEHDQIIVAYIKRLEKTLLYYANPDTYEGKSCGYEWAAPIENDKGQQALEVLQTRPKIKK